MTERATGFDSSSSASAQRPAAVYLTNLGCKLNQAELEQAARQFVAAGFRIAGSLAEADLHVVNSCTVTVAAARDSRKIARRGRRLNPAMRTVLTGCYAQDSPQEAAQLAGVDLVVPNADKERLVERVREAFGAGREPALPVPYVPLGFGNSRALVKVEDGCNMACAFCIIPSTRGRQRSRPRAQVVAEVAALAAAGFSEVVVTGVQISSYRWRGQGLYELTRSLLEETAVRRLRLTSIAPWEFDRRLLRLSAGGRLCRHFHLSLQSGCDATLRRMRRPYTRRQFADLVAEIRAEMPGVAITTDLIAGFPGETEAEFQECLETVRAIGFTRCHVFPFSPRPGTAAAAMPDPVEPRLRKRRVERLMAEGRRAELRFWRRHLGQDLEVLWERRRDGRWWGTTDNYIPVASAGGRDLERSLSAARLVALGAAHVDAEPANAPVGA